MLIILNLSLSMYIVAQEEQKPTYTDALWPRHAFFQGISKQEVKERNGAVPPPPTPTPKHVTSYCCSLISYQQPLHNFKKIPDQSSPRTFFLLEEPDWVVMLHSRDRLEMTQKYSAKGCLQLQPYTGRTHSVQGVDHWIFERRRHRCLHCCT